MRLNSETSRDWQVKARCRGLDPDLFYPDQGGDTDTPKRICHDCVVQVDCLEHALRYKERWGVWGGTSERERRHIYRQRQQQARRERERGNVVG